MFILQTEIICPYCGDKVLTSERRHYHWNKDHVFPKALYKWSKCPKELICQKGNVLVVHSSCNFDKGASIMRPADIEKLYIANENKKFLINLHEQLEPYIREYITLIKKLLKIQNNRCYNCRRRLNFHNLTIRRKYIDAPRVVSNAALICNTCGRYWEHKRKRNIERGINNECSKCNYEKKNRRA